MKIGKPFIYGNLAALTLNLIVLWVGAIKVFPPALAITILFACLGGAVWLPTRINGKL